jgi:hypothetical protein
MTNQVHIALIRDYRLKGLMALHEVIAADLVPLEKTLFSIKHTQEDLLIDNATRGQIMAIRRTLSLLEVLINDNPN